MRTRNPDARFIAVRNAIAKRESPTDNAYEAALYDILTSTGADTVVTYAYEVFSNKYEREIMQAWLLARATDVDIRATLRVPEEVSQAYRHLFFNVDQFRDELDLLSWVQEYAQSGQGSADGIQLMKTALLNGVAVLSWIYGRGECALEPETVLKQAMADAHFRSRAGRGAGMTSKEAAIAHQFANTAVKVAGQVSKIAGPSGADSLRIKLQYRDLTAPVEEIPKENLLH